MAILFGMDQITCFGAVGFYDSKCWESLLGWCSDDGIVVEEKLGRLSLEFRKMILSKQDSEWGSRR